MTALSTPGAADRLPLHASFTPEFILAEFRAFQDSGCRDQTFKDNAPFFVEALLAPLASRSPSPVGDAALVERVAEAIYDAMRENDPVGRVTPWMPRGNSNKQDEARRRARAALSPRPEEPK